MNELFYNITHFLIYNKTVRLWPDLFLIFFYYWFFLSCMFSRAAAQSRKTLHKLGVTHVLNAAHSKQGSIGDQSFYGDTCVYAGITADDSDHFDLSQYFKFASDFVHKGLQSKHGKVNVNMTSSVPSAFVDLPQLTHVVFVFFHVLHPTPQEKCWCTASWAWVDQPLWS